MSLPIFLLVRTLSSNFVQRACVWNGWLCTSWSFDGNLAGFDGDLDCRDVLSVIVLFLRDRSLSLQSRFPLIDLSLHPPSSQIGIGCTHHPRGPEGSLLNECTSFWTCVVGRNGGREIRGCRDQIRNLRVGSNLATHAHVIVEI